MLGVVHVVFFINKNNIFLSSILFFMKKLYCLVEFFEWVSIYKYLFINYWFHMAFFVLLD